MDLSDGLGADLPRLAEASEVTFWLAPGSIPCARGATLSDAINDGEDYELLFTVNPAHAKTLKKKWPFDLPLHFIGVMGARDDDSQPPHIAHGFDHFTQR
jgi:thiamine-monophosphate kinase